MKSFLLLFVLVFIAAASWGQGPQPADDPIAQNLFPPELVMKYSQEINLNEGQSKAMKRASTSEPFRKPELIAAADLDHGEVSEAGSISSDGKYLYFHRVLDKKSSQVCVLTHKLTKMELRRKPE